MPAAKAGFQYMFIYFKGPKPTVDILLDDLYLGEVLQRPDWKEHSDAHIDKYRKRNVRLRFVEACFDESCFNFMSEFLKTLYSSYLVKYGKPRSPNSWAEHLKWFFSCLN